MNEEERKKAYRIDVNWCLLVAPPAVLAGVLYTLHKGADVFTRSFLFPMFGFFLVVNVFVPVGITSAVFLYFSTRTQQSRYCLLAMLLLSAYWFWLVYECNKIQHVAISPFM
jgi:hypothetical protein